MQVPKLLKNQKLHSIANEHLIEALLFREFGIETGSGEKAWKQQWFHNTVLQDTLTELALDLGEDVIVLKGMALLDSIYEDTGKRFMSDIDLLIPERDLERISRLFKDRGFSPITEAQWYGNDFKTEWTKTVNGIEVNIELHTRLFFHTEDIEWSTKEYSISPLRCLRNEEMVLHLIGHCAFQHNFLKLYWLIDVYLFQREKNIDWARIQVLASEMKLTKSVESTVYVLNKFFDCKIEGVPIPNIKLVNLLNEELLINPNQIGKSYFKLKHLLKDSVLVSFQYDLLWILMKVKNLVKLK